MRQHLNKCKIHRQTNSHILSFVRLCVTLYACVWLCMTIYDYVWLCMTLFNYVWLCMTICDYVWLCVTMYACLNWKHFDCDWSPWWYIQRYSYIVIHNHTNSYIVKHTHTYSYTVIKRHTKVNKAKCMFVSEFQVYWDADASKKLFQRETHHD